MQCVTNGIRRMKRRAADDIALTPDTKAPVIDEAFDDSQAKPRQTKPSQAKSTLLLHSQRAVSLSASVGYQYQALPGTSVVKTSKRCPINGASAVMPKNCHAVTVADGDGDGDTSSKNCRKTVTPERFTHQC